MKNTLRAAPLALLAQAPQIVRENVCEIYKHSDTFHFKPFEVLLRHIHPSPKGEHVIGLDFTYNGYKGEHFNMSLKDCASYRRRMAKNRIHWQDIPEQVQKAILIYCESLSKPLEVTDTKKADLSLDGWYFETKKDK